MWGVKFSQVANKQKWSWIHTCILTWACLVALLVECRKRERERFKFRDGGGGVGAAQLIAGVEL